MDIDRILKAVGHDGFPALDDHHVRAFERTHEVKLPRAYREFLTHVANGAVLDLEPLGMVNEDGPLPWHESSEVAVGALRRPFPFAQPAALEETDDVPAIDGAVPLRNLGCGEWHWLVVSGPEAGNVWQIDFDAAKPLDIDGRRVDFEKYLEMRLPAGS